MAGSYRRAESANRMTGCAKPVSSGRFVATAPHELRR